MKHLKILTLLALILLLTVSAFATDGDAFYIRDGGTGNGSSAASASASLADAYNVLSESGGTVVVCGPYTISTGFDKIAHSGKITITSVYGGTDYRKTNNAAIEFGASMYLGGETEFCNIVLTGTSVYATIYAFNQPTLFGDGIVCNKVDDSSVYPSIVGGLYKAQNNQSSNVTINSGTWQRIRGGTGDGGSINFDVNITINGGTFIERVVLGSSPQSGNGSHIGNINATINGGEFRQGVIVAHLEDGNQFEGNINLTINGGTFYSRLGATANDKGTYTGHFTLTINGGEFAHLNELAGPGKCAGTMKTTIISTVDLTAKETGTYTLQNPIRRDGADPWLFYHDGYYYYTSTTSTSAVKLTRARNIGDLMYYSGTTIYTPEEGTPWAASTWSPTIIHYTDEEVGAGNGGWYLYFGAEDETDVSDVNHRMYVLKCLDGDNLLGSWGNPITGEINVPQRVSAPDIANFDDIWAAGQGDIRINGKVYNLYVTEVNKHTKDYYQTINIIQLSTPWEFKGTPTVICTPTYDWEMYGYGKIYDENGQWTGLWAPKVVEAATPVYGSDGSVFVVYSGSNYTTDNYCLGQLKFKGGDPMVASNWQKKSTPILSQGNGVRGTGSASYVTDASGQGWVCYNAYLDSDENRTRHAMVEPYTATSSGVVIGDGSGKAAAETKTYKAAVNPMSVAEKMSGFDSIYVHGEMTENGARITFTPAENANSYRIWRDNTRLDTVTASSNVLEYTDTNVPTGAHTYKVEVRKRSVTGSMSTLTTSTTRIANYSGLVHGDMNGDGMIGVADALLLLRNVLSGRDDVSLVDVMHLLKCIF